MYKPSLFSFHIKTGIKEHVSFYVNNLLVDVSICFFR